MGSLIDLQSMFNLQKKEKNITTIFLSSRPELIVPSFF